MTIKIKNCGLKTPKAIACSVISGASFIGFVHHASSPRHLAPSEISALYPHVPKEVSKVLVLVDPTDALLDSLPAPDFWQIHGVSDPKRIAAIHQRTRIPVISGMRVRSVEDIALAKALDAVSIHLLFDAYHEQEMGGSGLTFDWSLLSSFTPTRPWFLAGGLTAQNVTEAIRTTHAPMVDVSSGLEESAGIKSLEKIAAFNAAVLNATH